MKALVALCALALCCASAASGSRTHLGAPTRVHAFVYVAGEALKTDHTYAEMPAFAWAPVDGAKSYEIQLATSTSFSDATLLYDKTSSAPVDSIQLQVPWMTGSPYALWVRVRATSASSTSAWSAPFGFNTQWQQVPTRLAAPDGLIRWTPVDGATAYEVWYLTTAGSTIAHFTTLDNVADERELRTFDQGARTTFEWRVRAVRNVPTATLPNGVGVTQYGPYSAPVTVTTGAGTSGALKSAGAFSDVESTPGTARAHQLTPGFTWTGTTAPNKTSGSGLYRVYIFSDKQCVNLVMKGSIVGSPAWAPRLSAPITLPATEGDIGKYNPQLAATGSQSAVMADGTVVTPSETGSSSATISSATAAAISLPDNGWPQGRYWWTVVPVQAYEVIADAATGPTSSDAILYKDTELPQDACAAGSVWPFGVQSAPVTTSSQTPYASGLYDGRVVSAARTAPSFSELPLITWSPAIGAQSYEIEVSHALYPWKAVQTQTSVVTSAVLSLTKANMGTWYYRVRGIDPFLLGDAQKMAWSKPVKLRISGDTFHVVG